MQGYDKDQCNIKHIAEIVDIIINGSSGYNYISVLNVINYLFNSQNILSSMLSAMVYIENQHDLTLGLQCSARDKTNVYEIIKDDILVFSCLERLIRAVGFGGWFIKELNLTKSLEECKQDMIGGREGRLYQCKICKLN